MAPRFREDEISRLVLDLPDRVAWHRLEKVVDQCCSFDDLRRALDQCLSDCLRACHDPAIQKHVVALLVKLNRRGLERILAEFTQDKNKIDDAIQQGTLKALLNIKTFLSHEDQGRFFPWIHAIVRRCLIDEYRKNRRLTDSLPPDLADGSPDPAVIVEIQEESDLLKHRLDKLSPFEKRLWTMRVDEGLSLMEIFQTLKSEDWPEGEKLSFTTFWRRFQVILAKLAGTDNQNGPKGGQS